MAAENFDTDQRTTQTDDASLSIHGARLDLQGLSKKFGQNYAVQDLNLVVESGEFFALLGPSGCGKTTSMRMIAGFESNDEGKVLIDGADAASMLPSQRQTGMVFQSYALFPHYSVFMNVAYGLIMDDLYNGPPKKRFRALMSLMSKKLAASNQSVAERVEVALEQVALNGYQKRKISELSGGQQQRVALARALVKQPKVLLMDEPLSNLDKRLRVQTRETIREIQVRTGITALFVTHDQEEAMGMADRVGVMRDGNLVQVGTPTEVYEYPKDEWIANFVGNSNIMEGTLGTTAEGAAQVEVDGTRLTIREGTDISEGQSIKVLIRPENILVLPESQGAERQSNTLRATVKIRAFLGPVVQYTLESPIGTLLVEQAFQGATTLRDEGDEVLVSLPAESLRLLAAEEALE